MPGLRVRREGSGPLAILLPSLGRPGSDLDEIAAAVRATGRSTAIVDPHGTAGSPPLPEGATLRDIAADVMSAASGEDGPVSVIGHAFGNRVARCMAADFPGRVQQLILLGCGGKFSGDASARASLSRCFDEALPAADHLAAVAEAFFAPGHDPGIWAGGWQADTAAAQRRAGAAVPVDHWWLTPAPVTVLAIVGANDLIAPPDNALSLAAALGPRGTAVVIPDAGHALLPEQPEAVARAVTSWLARHPATRPLAVPGQGSGPDAVPAGGQA